MTPDSEVPREQLLLQELEATREKREAATDHDVRDALDLKIADLAKRISALANKPPEAPELQLQPPTPQQLVEADSLIRLARVEKMRGNKSQSTEFLRRAAQAAPTAPSVLEALGDDLVERRHMKEAREIYGKACKLDPKNVGLERKYANTVLGTTNTMSIEDQLRFGLSDTPLLSSQDHIASSWAATVLTIFLPGLGHIVLGKNAIGFSILGAWLASAIWLLIMRKDFIEMLASLDGAKSHFSYLVLVPMFLLVAIYISCLASLRTPKSSGARGAVARPRPPVDMKFD